MAGRTPTNDFQIIALRTGKGCSVDYLKVLVPDEIYYFLPAYTIDKTSFEITPPQSSETLFDDPDLSITVSAIAGQNGTGKSTIIELLLMGINNLGKAGGVEHDLKPVFGLEIDLFIKTEQFFKISISDEDVWVYPYGKDGKPGSPIAPDDLAKYFYSVVINYSHYAYNSTGIKKGVQEDWLTPLFHKNDSYQTPVVINPWREEGNIIINRENELVRTRLIATLCRKPNAGFNFRNITENHQATHLRLSLNTKKVDSEVEKEFIVGARKKWEVVSDLKKLPVNDILEEINVHYNIGFINGDYVPADMNPKRYAMKYVARKLISMSIKYKDYDGYYDIGSKSFSKDNLTAIIKKALADHSHITFKFKQALNYIKNDHIPFIFGARGDEDNDIKIDILADTIAGYTGEEAAASEILNYLPPPIFKVEIIVKPRTGPEKKVLFETLSSGEKQMTFSVSSVLYHLINLDSVKKSDTIRKYEFINIILEEIELYFHPEMQRKYVKALRDGILNLGVTSIKGINIIFVTHSPFILSDIPGKNVMFLKIENGNTTQIVDGRKTFGANIHNLMADGFFMENTLWGAFADERIIQAIKFINIAKRISFLKDQLDDPLVKLTNKLKKEYEDEKIKLEAGLTEDKKSFHRNVIRHVAEPVMSFKLKSMFDEAFGTSRLTVLEEQLKELNDEINTLRNAGN